MKHRRGSTKSGRTLARDSSTMHHLDESSSSSLEISESLLKSSSESSSECRGSDATTGDSDSTRVLVKPPLSYATLITEAIESSAEKQLILSEIYEFVEEHYPYFRTAGQGWKVSSQSIYLILLFRTRSGIIFP